MPVVSIRVRVPERAGALGQVASRIGALGGDITEVEILEHSDTGAIDDFLVDLPEGIGAGLVESELEQVDGVQVEHVLPAHRRHTRSALDAAVAIAESADSGAEWTAVATHALEQLACDWMAVIDEVSGEVLFADGAPPPVPWLQMLAEAQHGEATAEGGPSDRNGLAVIALVQRPVLFLAGRAGVAFREREHRELRALVRIAEVCGSRAGLARSVAAHPSAHPSARHSTSAAS